MTNSVSITKYDSRCTNVSCAADQQFINRLNAFAKLANVRTGDLVRHAIESTYGKDIAIFFAGTVAFEQQLETES